MKNDPPDTVHRFWTAGAVSVFGLALVVRAAYWYMAGTRVSPDGYAYLSMCGPFWHEPLGWFSGAIEVEYLGFQAPLCVFLALPGTTIDHWVLVQILMTSLAATLLFDAARRRYGVVAGYVAGLSMAVLWETAQWDVYILSESTFLFVLSLTIWGIVKHAEEPASGHARALLAGTLIWLAFTRPVGMPIAVAILAWDLLPATSAWRLALVARPWQAVLVVSAAVILVATDSSRGDWAASAVGDVYRQGLLVHDDPTFRFAYTAHEAESFSGFVLANMGPVAVMGVLKSLLFFLPWVGRFSLLHNAVNTVTLVPVFLLAGTGAIRSMRAHSPDLRWWLTPIVVIVGIAALTFIDYDWRYRAPLTPFLGMLAASAFAAGTPFEHACQKAGHMMRQLLPGNRVLGK